MQIQKHMTKLMLLQSYPYKVRYKKIKINVLNRQVEAYETTLVECTLESLALPQIELQVI